MPVKNKRTFEDYHPGFYPGDKAFEKKVARHNLGDISASGNYHVFAAPSEVRITAIKLVVDTTITISTTNYWTVQLANMTRVDDLLATADNMNYDSTLTNDTVYEITPDQNINLAPDDVLELQLTKVASADNLSGLLVEIEYVVTGVVTTTSTTTTTTTTTT